MNSIDSEEENSKIRLSSKESSDQAIKESKSSSGHKDKVPHAEASSKSDKKKF